MSLDRHPEPLSGWGRYPRHQAIGLHPADRAEVARATAAAAGAIARGNGRAYGDAAVGAAETIHLDRLDRFVSFDPETGLLVGEAGLLLAEVIAVMVPRGWFVPVVPGTRFVTLGGMVAADVHGKNHHAAGSFCDHVAWIEIDDGGVGGSGGRRRCDREKDPMLFAATCGGMGLTGVICTVAVRMQRIETAMIRQRRLRVRNLDAAMAAFEANLATTYSVAWIDCLATGAALGRSALFLGEHATRDELPAARRDRPLELPASGSRPIPIDFPDFALSKPVVRTFNALYYRRQSDAEALVDLLPYFFPLDSLLEWNRIYGRRGFVQYQCVLPLAASAAGLRLLLGAIAAAGAGSFLGVLKRMGPQSFGLLSFPREGYTLALDFPASPANLALLDRLDAITADHGGRIYLAKDARAAPATMAGYDRLDAFRALRAERGYTTRFASRLSQRLEL